MAYTILQLLHNTTKVLEMITRRHSSISKSVLNLTTKGILYNKVGIYSKMNSCMQFFYLGEEGIFTFFDLNNMILAYRKEFYEKKSHFSDFNFSFIFGL
jgi:hypothetical protein